MRSCHNCPTQPQPGRTYARSPCRDCDATADDGGLVSRPDTISIHAASEELVYRSSAPHAVDEDESEAVAAAKAYVASFMVCLLSLPRDTRDMLIRRMRGDEYLVISRDYRMTAQAVEDRIDSIVKDTPFVRNCLPEKVERAKRRNSPTGATPCQTTPR